jgi:putative flippase GtrA
VKSFLRFAFLSGGGWLLDCAILLCLTHLTVPLGLANFLSSATAAVTVFLVSRLFVFRGTRTPALSRAAMYLAYQTASILLASALIGPAAGLGRSLAETGGWVITAQMAYFLGKILITPPQLVANFLVSKFLIQHFRRPAQHV